MYQQRFDAREFSFDRQDGRFMIDFRETGETVGYIGCYGFRPLHSAVMGIAVARKYWGKGLAFDAQEVLLKFLFDELGLRVVEYYARHRELVDHPSVWLFGISRG